ncbi:MAG: NAD(P)H-hydrate dehydratase [Cyanobacteria bacterium P01_A01_bin.80]
MSPFPISQFVVTADQMRDIEGRIFAAGMPVTALMEKVAGLIFRRIIDIFPLSSQYLKVGILVGPGHNGGDAVVVARELHLHGYQVCLYHPFNKSKDLTSRHLEYAQSLGIPSHQSLKALQTCNFFIDGLFGFGLERAITDNLAQDIEQINQWDRPVVSIDLPSGIHTDTGEVLGSAICATYTLCLGLWKQGLLQEHAIEYIGKAELIDFGIPISDIEAVLGKLSSVKRITKNTITANLPLPRPLTTYKYKQGHLLLVCGSKRYTGGAILTALGSRASGVGMLSVAVPESIKHLLVSHLPEAVIIGCPETETGAISNIPFPAEKDFNSFSAIVCGPGITTDATSIVEQILASNKPLILDADGLNIVAKMGTSSTLQKRQADTILTPHTGEFTRLFLDIKNLGKDRIDATKEAANQSGAVVLLKGARTVIAAPNGNTWINPESTPALARGGSGDVLAGLMGGLLAQSTSDKSSLNVNVVDTVATSVWWHAQAGILAAAERTELGVDAFTLTQYLLPVISNI